MTTMLEEPGAEPRDVQISGMGEAWADSKLEKPEQNLDQSKLK